MQPDLWFDFYPYDNPKAGARLVRLTNQQLLGGSFFRVERRGTGSGKVVLNSGQAEFTAANLHEENLVEVGDANVSATDPLGGFLLHRGDFEVISRDEQGGEDFGLGGPGLLAYAAREIMWSHTYFSPDIDPSVPVRGMDPFDDLWRLNAAFSGSSLGAMLWRAVWEGQHFRTGAYGHYHGDGELHIGTHADDRLSSAISELVMDFTNTLDSDGNAWTAYSGAYHARIKQQILSVALELVGKGIDIQMRGGRQLILSAYNSYGRDFRGSSFGAGVVRFAHGVNVANPARRAIEAGLNGSRALVGSNDEYAVVNSPVAFHVTRSIGLDSDAEDPAALAIDGLANLRARKAGSDVPALKVHYGDDPTNGRYLFAPPEVGGHAWLGDLVTIHRGAGAFQWNNADARIEAIQFDLTDEKVWDDPTVEFGAVYRSADERGRAAAIQAIAGKRHGPHIRLCPIPQASGDVACNLPAGQYKASANEAEAPENCVEGTVWDSSASPTSEQWWAVDLASAREISRASLIQPGTATHVGTGLRVWRTSDAGKWAAISGPGYDFGAAGWTEVDTFSIAAGANELSFTTASGRYWVLECTAGGSGTWQLDEIRLYTAGGLSELIGTSSYAARCDHSEHVLRDRAPTATDDEVIGYPLKTLWTDTVGGGSYILVDRTAGAAVWQPIVSSSSSTAPAWLIDANAAPYSMTAGHGGSDQSEALTDAIAAAIAAAVAAGSGVAVVEIDAGHYDATRALQTTDSARAQVVIPAYTGQNLQLIIRAKHQVGVAWTNWTVASAAPGAVILHSTLTGQTYSGTFGTPSIIGGPDATSTRTNLQVHMRGIIVRQAANPSLCGFYGYNLQQMILEDVIFDTEETFAGGITEPTNATGVACIVPKNGNNAVADYRGLVLAQGYFAGVAIGEHTYGAKVYALRCKVGVNVQECYHHAAQIDYLGIEQCTHSIGTVLPQTGITSPSGANSIAALTVDLLDLEDAASGWYAPTYHINDPDSRIHGHIEYLRVLAGVGTQTGALTLNGATNLALIDLTDVDFGASGSHPNLATHDALGLATDTELTAAVAAHAATPHGGSSELLISDTPSTPLVFADVLQNEAQDDLLYSD